MLINVIITINIQMLLLVYRNGVSSPRFGTPSY